MSTQNLLAASLRTGGLLPAGRLFLWASKHLIWTALSSICSVDFRAASIFLPALQGKGRAISARRDAARSGGREVGAQLLAGDGRRVGVDQDEGEDARSGSVVDPGVHCAALDDDVARLQMRHLAAVELEIALARQQQGIIDGLGAVHEFGRAGREFGDPDDGTLAGADVIVAGDEPLALGR